TVPHSSFLAVLPVGLKRMRNPDRTYRAAVGYASHAPPKGVGDDAGADNEHGHLKIYLPKKLLECLPKCSSLPKERHRWNTNEVRERSDPSGSAQTAARAYRGFSNTPNPQGANESTLSYTRVDVDVAETDVYTAEFHSETLGQSHYEKLCVVFCDVAIDAGMFTSVERQALRRPRQCEDACLNASPPSACVCAVRNTGAPLKSSPWLSLHPGCPSTLAVSPPWLSLHPGCPSTLAVSPPWLSLHPGCLSTLAVSPPWLPSTPAVSPPWLSLHPGCLSTLAATCLSALLIS
ncbi:hypothetical protein P4O66_006104, partial [Electrophorus voltai]